MYQNIIKSVAWMFAGNASQQILQFLTFIFLARHLTPEVFGQVALASVVTDIAVALSAWGIPQFLLQRGMVSKKMLSHAFLLSLLIALIFSLLIVAGVGFYAYMGKYTLISQLMLLLTPLLLIQALGIVPEAVIRRNLEFKWIAIRNNLAAILAGVVAIALAYKGMGVYALVAQRIVGVGILTITVWFASGGVKLINIAQYRVANFVLISRQSLRTLSNPIATLVGLRAMDGIVGMFLGSATLGQFKIVWRIYDLLVQLIITPLSSISFAAFPKLISDNSALRDFYNNNLKFALVIFVPIMTGAAFTADNWVPLMLGDHWLEVVPIFHIVSLTSIQVIIGTFQNSLQMSLRWNHFILKQNTCRLIISVVLAVIAAQVNIYLVLIFYVVQNYALALYNTYAINQARKWPWHDSLDFLLPSVVPTIIMLSLLMAAKTIDMPSDTHELILQVSIGCISYLGSFLLLFPKQRALILRLVRKIISRN